MKGRSRFASLLCFISSICNIVSAVPYLQVGMDILSQDAGGDNAAAIDMSNDGKFIAVGSPHAGTIDQVKRGEVKIYQSIRNDSGETVWQQIGNTLVGNQAGANFGISVAISFNGKRLVVGNLLDDNEQGAISVFRYVEKNNKWKWIATFLGESINDRFGFRVGISSNGNKVFGAALGYVKVFKCDDVQCKANGSLINIDNTLNVRGVSLASGGQSLAVGAIPKRGITVPGLVKVYTFDGIDWQEKNIFTGPITDRSFGFSAAISQNQNDITVAYSAPLASCQAGDLNCGAIKVFSSNDQGNSFVQLGGVIEGTGGSGLGIDIDLSVNKNTIVATSINSSGGPVVSVYSWDDQLNNWVFVQNISADPDVSLELQTSASIDTRTNADGRRVIFVSPSGFMDSTNVVRVFESPVTEDTSTAAPSQSPSPASITYDDCNSGKGKGKGKGKSECKPEGKGKGKGKSFSVSPSSKGKRGSETKSSSSRRRRLRNSETT
mmetsp:Transcript_15205/g.28600  ORF Transcript_15205/g.28600 Transcript_15205/m.28600 type:complete len:493 (+) Transcript_15205:74-1552(+)